MQPCVYILASQKNGTVYVGVTSDLVKRVWQHKNEISDGFAKQYQVHTLVWYELCESMESAIVREKQLKEWKRSWKLELIEKTIQLGAIYMMKLFNWIPTFVGMTAGSLIK